MTVKTLPEILRDAILLLDEACKRVLGKVVDARELHWVVVIARGAHDPLDERSEAFQIRLRHDVDMGLSEYRCEVRSWLGEQWSSWREQRGWLGGGSFDTSDVLATDWRIVS